MKCEGAYRNSNANGKEKMTATWRKEGRIVSPLKRMQTYFRDMRDKGQG